MFLIKTFVQPSGLHGLGVFVAEPVAAGTPVWKFHPGFDQNYTLNQVNALPEPCRVRMWHYGYVSYLTGQMVLCMDDARFMNHSSTPTLLHVEGPEGGFETAARDLAVGEELTYDYLAHDVDGPRKLGVPGHRVLQS